MYHNGMDKFKDGSCLPKTLTENALKVYILKLFPFTLKRLNVQPVQIPQKMIFFTLYMKSKLTEGQAKMTKKYCFKLIKNISKQFLNWCFDS